MKRDTNFFNYFSVVNICKNQDQFFNQQNTLYCKFRTFAILENEKKKREKETTFLNIV